MSKTMILNEMKETHNNSTLSCNKFMKAVLHADSKWTDTSHSGYHNALHCNEEDEVDVCFFNACEENHSVLE